MPVRTCDIAIFFNIEPETLSCNESASVPISSLPSADIGSRRRKI
jgi:hypothetical protein